VNKLSLSVIVPTYNRHNDLEECLRSLFEMKQPPDEVIVVDSCSTDGTYELVKQFQAKYLCIRERSMVKARNVGLRHATGDVVAYIDDDVIVSESWSIHILDSYEDEKVGGVGGRVLPYSTCREACIPVHVQEIDERLIGKVLNDGIVLGNFDVPTSTPIEVDTLIGCNMSFRRKLLIRIGGFDEKFQGNCYRDDTDACLRLKRLGYKLVYNPKALVWHKFRGKSTKLSWYYWTAYNHTYFFLKNFRPLTMKRLLDFLHGLFPYSYYSYVKKSGVKFKLRPLTITYAFLGLIAGVYACKGDLLWFRKLLRID